jgi:hypothetical protein
MSERDKAREEIEEEEQEEEQEEKELAKLGDDEGKEEKGDVLETLVKEIDQDAKGIKYLDTGFIINDNFDSVYIVDGKVKFAPLDSKEYHDLDWAVTRANVMDLYNILYFVKMLLPSFKNPGGEDDRALLNRLLG